MMSRGLLSSGHSVHLQRWMTFCVW